MITSLEFISWNCQILIALSSHASISEWQMLAAWVLTAILFHLTWLLFRMYSCGCVIQTGYVVDVSILMWILKKPGVWGRVSSSGTMANTSVLSSNHSKAPWSVPLVRYLFNQLSRSVTYLPPLSTCTVNQHKYTCRRSSHCFVNKPLWRVETLCTSPQ